MLMKAFFGTVLKNFKINPLLISPCRTSVYTPDTVKPIFDKIQLEKIKADDDIHTKKIRPVDGTESPAFSYHPLIRKFMNKLMSDGKSAPAREIMDRTFYKIKLRQLEKWNATEESKRDSVETNPLKIFLTAIDNCKPVVQMSAVRKAGILYQVPVPISEISREFRAMKFLVNSCRRRDKVRFYDRLANEILLAYQNEGQAVSKKIELHKQAEANRAYAHYRWSK